MNGDLTHASFFSGVGGLDLGLERAGWRTVSFSEIDPYASAVLAGRWPGVPNLGDIVQLAGRFGSGSVLEPGDGPGTQHEPDASRADLWTGGFPCQDLSVAGKRRGMGAGTRSGLAYSFLALAERYRPRFVLLENVPGLLSSHGGRDMAALLGALVELGYGVGYRIVDARYFGVPQRRRRVFILGDSLGGRAGAERASEVLSVGSRCHRHPPTGIEAGPGTAGRAQPGVDIARAVTGTSGKRHDDDTDTDTLVAGTLRVGSSGAGSGGSAHAVPIVGAPIDPSGVRAPDGVAGRLDDRAVAATLNSGGNRGGFRTEPGEHLVYRKATKAHSSDDWERWEAADETDPLTANGLTARTATAVVGGGMNADPLLPLGLDSHRYRCCGNGVVAPVSEWIGHRLAAELWRPA